MYYYFAKFHQYSRTYYAEHDDYYQGGFGAYLDAEELSDLHHRGESTDELIAASQKEYEENVYEDHPVEIQFTNKNTGRTITFSNDANAKEFRKIARYITNTLSDEYVTDGCMPIVKQ